MKRVLGIAAVVGFFGVGVLAAGATAQEILFRSTIIGSNPKIVIAGVQSGVAPWTVGRGSAVLDEEGGLSVALSGLVITSLGTPGPVTSVAASLVCGGSGGSVAATTDAVPLSGDGNAEIEGKITVPSPCFGPIVLVRAAAVNGSPLPQPGPWISSNGFGSASGGNDDQEDEDLQ